MKLVTVKKIVEVSPDTKKFVFKLPYVPGTKKKMVLGMPTGCCLWIEFDNPNFGKETWNGREDPEKDTFRISRTYTPTSGDDWPGYMELTCKIYRPGTVMMPSGIEYTWTDGGKAGRYLDNLKPGDQVSVFGPLGRIKYKGRGKFQIGEEKPVFYKEVGLLAGGAGITPILQLLKGALDDPGDTTVFSLIYANKREEDILYRRELREMESLSAGRFRLHITLQFPLPSWDMKEVFQKRYRMRSKGMVTEDMMLYFLPKPNPKRTKQEGKVVTLICGPPLMVTSCEAMLKNLGYINYHHF